MLERYDTNHRPSPPQLVIPKHHGEKLLDIPDDALSEILVFIGPLLPFLETGFGV